MSPFEAKVCIFDVNGVLIDSNEANARAMSEAFTEDPELKARIVTLYLTLTGIDRGEKIRRIQEAVFQRPFQENEFELRWEQFKERGRESMLRAPLAPGAKAVLVELGLRKVRRVALSNTPGPELQSILRARGLAPLLDMIRGGGNWPKADSLSRLVDEFRFEPGQCLFFGDGKGDLAAARHVGVPFVGIDPGTGEFQGAPDVLGPFRNLEEWAQENLKSFGKHPC